MKQGQLGEPAGRAEMFLRPFFQIRRIERAAPLGEVQLAQETVHPDIDGKGVPAAIGVEEDATGDFRADPGQPFKVFGGTFRGPSARDSQISRLSGENFGGGREMLRAVAQLTATQGLFPRAGEAFGGGEFAAGTPEGQPDSFVDLADLDDLLERGADEVREALPGILAEGAEAGMGLTGFRQPAISAGGGMEEKVEVEIKAEVLFQGGAGKQGVIPEKPSVADRKRDGLVADPAGKLARSGLIPAKGLTAQEGGGEIERNGELQGRHCGRKLKA